MNTYLPALKLQMVTMRQSLGCPGVLDSVGTSIMPIFRYLLVFAAYLTGAPANLHMKMNHRRNYNHPPFKVVGYGSDFFCRVTFCWPIKSLGRGPENFSRKVPSVKWCQ